MKNYKTVDLLIQAALIPACFLYALMGNNIFIPYFIVGCWQMLSVAVHLFLRRHYLPLKMRGYYSFIAISVLLVGFLLFVNGSSITVLYGYFMLLVSPFLALWYAFVCYEERKLLKHKELVHLK